MFVGKERLVGDVVVSGHLGQSDHELLGFCILGEVRRGHQQDFCLGLW